MQDHGKFIVLEGTDGSGTSTQGDQLAAWLQGRGLEVVRAAQPSHLPGGQIIRRILRGEEGPVDACTVALLFAADRVDLCQRVVEPALQRGAWVICDRHVASSLAFQVVDGAGGIDPAWVLAINAKARAADLTLWLHIPVAMAMQRIADRGKPMERFEVESTLERVRSRYAELAARPPQALMPIAEIDATGTRETVAYAIRQRVEDEFTVPERR